MSVRNRAGRHPRPWRVGSPTADPLGTRHLANQPIRREAGRAAGSGHRRPAPLLACLVVFALAGAEAATSWLGSGPTAILAGSFAARGSVTGAERWTGGSGLASELDPAVDAPRRILPFGMASAASSVATALAMASAGDPPSCTHADRPAPRAGLADWATTIVDTAFVLPPGYQPADLVSVAEAGVGGWGLVRSLVIDDLRALAEAADRAGNPIAVQSGYRSRSRQAEVYAGWVASSGEADARRFSARPGHSEHQLGTALDLRAAAGGAPWTGAFATTAAGHWLAQHAADYGFVLSYPAGAARATCYGAEAWHVRYVGRAIAARVAASGLPLRVWLWRFGGG